MALGCFSIVGAGNFRELKRKCHLISIWIFIATSTVAWGQMPARPAPDHPVAPSQNAARTVPSFPLATLGNETTAKRELDSYRVDEVKGLPGSHEFGSHFIEAMGGDPNPAANDARQVWGLTADLSSKVAARDRALYISKSADGGKTWTAVARLNSRYFNADVGEGERNGLGVLPGGAGFVVTTQKGAFQVFPRSRTINAVVKLIAGPHVPGPNPRISIAKRAGAPVTAGVVKITPDGKHMIVGYGYFDLNPQIFTYHRAGDGPWIEERSLPPLPTRMDILSMEFGDPKQVHPDALYVGTGDQAYRLSFHTMQWARIEGVGPDSAIQGISMVEGPHLAACWGVYNPINAYTVERVIHASFLLHRATDEAGSNLRAFGIEVDPLRPNREIVTSITGAYASSNRGNTWKRLNNLPDGEYRSAHFNPDGTVIVSGFPGAFLVNPFSKVCSPRLRTRDR